MKETNTEYFASVPVEDLAEEMTKKITSFRKNIKGSGLAGLWAKKLSNYYGKSFNGNASSAVTQGGSEGELSLIKVNDLHNLLSYQLVIVTSERAAGMARAINSDTASLRSAKIGTALSEYYLSQANFEATFVQATETALLCDEAFTEIGWDMDEGDPIEVDEEGKPIMSGDLFLRMYPSWLVARDFSANCNQQTWYILSRKVNKFDRAATYPKFRDEILSCKTTEDDLDSLDLIRIDDDSDMIYEHTLIHDRTPSMPEGRLATMINGTIVFDNEGGLPYKDFPVDRITPAPVIDGPTGYSPSNDVLAMEEVTDALHSAITTNEVNFATQSIVGPEGANLNVSDLAKGLRYFELPATLVDKLRPLQMTATSQSTFSYLDRLGSKKDQMLGINSIIKGQPEGQLSGASGSAMALLQAQAISFNSGTQRSYFRLLSSVMTKGIGVLAKFADSERVVQITGKTKAPGLKSFKYTGKDLSAISSLVFEVTNPISQTVGGRLQMAQDLIKAEQITSPKQYINVVQTGNLEVLTDDDESKEMLIVEENELLAEGKPIEVVSTENHQDHIKSHMSVLSSPQAKADANIVNQTLGHIQKHLDTWQQLSQSNPALLLATGQQPLPPPPPPPMPPGIPGPGGPPQGPQGPGAPQGGANPAKVVGNGQNPVMSPQMQPNQPKLPTNPATHQQAQVPGVPA